MRSNKPQVDFVKIHILHHTAKRSLHGLWIIEDLAEHGYTLNAIQLYLLSQRLQKSAHINRTKTVLEGKLHIYYNIMRDGRAYLKEQKRELVELISKALMVAELSQALHRRQKREEAMRRSA